MGIAESKELLAGNKSEIYFFLISHLIGEPMNKEVAFEAISEFYSML